MAVLSLVRSVLALGEPLRRLSVREAWILDVTCAVFVHLIYNRYEPQPIDVKQTGFLLVVVPLLPSYVLLAHLPSRSSPFAIMWTLFQVFAVFYSSLVTSIVVYRLSPFHSLAGFPGPRLAKTSQLWHTFILNSGKRHESLKRLHDKYGPYVRIGPNEISCTDVDAFPHVLGPDGLPKGPLWKGRHIPGHLPTLVGIQNTSDHQERRKPWNRAFSTAAVKGYEEILEFRVKQLAEELEKLAVRKNQNYAESVDLSAWFSRFSFDFMGDMAFGGGFNLMTEGDTEGIWHLMESGIKQAAALQHLPYLSPLIWKIPSVIASFFRMIEFCKRLVVERIERGSRSKDLFHYLMSEDKQLQENEQPPSLELMISDSSLAVIAGSDTTATIVANVFFNLLSNPDAYARLRKEVDKHFPLDAEYEVVDSAKSAEMPYLNAVINEAMRLQPAVPVNIQRSTRDQAKWIGSCALPPNTAINLPPYVIHRDPKYFSPLPDAFWPDRWLPPSQRKPPAQFKDKIDLTKVTTNATAFIPFSSGPANCAGKNLAILEMRTVVCMLVRRFEMRFEEGYEARKWNEGLEDYFTFVTGRLPVVLTSRF